MQTNDWPEPIYREQRPLDRALLVADATRIFVLTHIGPDLDALAPQLFCLDERHGEPCTAQDCAACAEECDGAKMVSALTLKFEELDVGPGVWIWEGRAENGALVGATRPLTDAEWAAFCAGEMPWNTHEWQTPGEGVFVVKLQVSLHTSDGVPRLLAYNEDRTLFHQEDITPEHIEVARLMEGRPKAFFEARLTPERKLDVGPEVPDPGW